MPAAPLVAVCLALFALAYWKYGGFLARTLFETEGDDTPTPATTMTDGVDYVPADRHVLLGHHFTSVAGAAPIVGPAVAVVYGWVPAVLWIVLGVIFIGAMHDFGSLVVSVRNKGKSVGEIAGSLVSGRARVLFLLLIVVLTWLVLAAFASIIGTLFDKNPASVVPINLEIPLAIAIGWWHYRRGGSLLWTSIVALLVMWGSVWFSTNYEGLQFAFTAHPEGHAQAGQWVVWESLRPDQVWVVLLLAYSFVTCVMPVWLLLQPRDFINSHQLFVGLAVIYGAIFLSNPEIVAPAVNENAPAKFEHFFPLLFVTIACGAISGFHSLVSSGTTSKQIKSMRDAKPIGYGSMLGEGALALAATMAVAAGLSNADWHAHYTGPDAKGGGLVAFVFGTANLLEGAFLFIDHEVAMTIVAVIVISFAATTLDTACRIQRFCLGELGAAFRIAPLQNRYIAAAIAAFTPLALVLDAADGRPMWKHIWPVFGASNQLLGALALMVVTLWLKRRGKSLLWTGIPAVFLTVVTGSALVSLIIAQFERPQGPLYPVLIPAVILFVLAAAVIFEGCGALFREGPEARDTVS